MATSGCSSDAPAYHDEMLIGVAKALTDRKPIPTMASSPKRIRT